MSSVANTGICKLKIDNIATAIMLAYKIAFMLIISYGEVLYYFYSYFFGIWQDELIVVKNKNLVNFQATT
ncbi:MAG: hypothetical protein ACRD7F_02645 [Nitrososphaeraceae archaeon]